MTNRKTGDSGKTKADTTPIDYEDPDAYGKITPDGGWSGMERLVAGPEFLGKPRK